LDIAGFAQALTKCAQPAREHVRRFTAEVSYHRLRRLLCTRHERPRSRSAAKQRDEVAAPHGGYPQGQGLRTSIAGASVACIATKTRTTCPVRVRLGPRRPPPHDRLGLPERIWRNPVVMSQKCQKRTFSSLKLGTDSKFRFSIFPE